MRAGALLLGVLYHAAHAYTAQTHVPWLVRAPDGSWLLHDLQAVSHLFRMPLFFVIAGFFARWLIERDGPAGMATHRLKRLGGPFLLFWPLLAVAGAVVVLEARGRPGVVGLAPRPGLHTMHLWFLEYLLLFCLAAATLHRVRVPGAARLRAWLFDFRFGWLVLPALLLPALGATPLAVDPPTALAPALWPFGYYGLFFLLGHQLFHHPGWPTPFAAAPVPVVLAVSLPVYLRALQTGEAGWAPRLAAAWASVALVVGALALGALVFRRTHRAVRYLADASYWIYLVHLPVVLALQVALVPLSWGPWASFAAVSAATLAFTLVTYALLVRPTPLGVLLNGRRGAARRRPPHR